MSTISGQKCLSAADANISDINLRSSDVVVASPALCEVNPVASLDLICLRLALFSRVGVIQASTASCALLCGKTSHLTGMKDKKTVNKLSMCWEIAEIVSFIIFVISSMHGLCLLPWGGGERSAIPDSSWIRLLILLLYGYKTEHPLLN